MDTVGKRSRRGAKDTHTRTQNANAACYNNNNNVKHAAPTAPGAVKTQKAPMKRLPFILFQLEAGKKRNFA